MVTLHVFTLVLVLARAELVEICGPDGCSVQDFGEDADVSELLQINVATSGLAEGPAKPAVALVGQTPGNESEGAAPEATPAASQASTVTPIAVYELLGVWLILGLCGFVMHIKHLDPDINDGMTCSSPGAAQDAATEQLRLLSYADATIALAHEKDSKHKFTFYNNWRLAVRASVMIMFAALPEFMPGVREWFNVMTYDTRYTAVLVLWTMGRTVGQTMANVKDAMVGTVLAFVFMYIIAGAFPGGVHVSSPPYVWYVGVGYTLFTILFMLFLNFPCGTRVWCLSYHVGNMMYFLKPKPDDSPSVFSDGFHINVKGIMFGYVVMTTFACWLAVVGTALPSPLSSYRNAMDRMDHTKRQFGIMLRSMLQVYLRDTTDDPADELVRIEMYRQNYAKNLGVLEVEVGNAWFEHFDLGKYRAIRKSLGSYAAMSKQLLWGAQALKESIATDSGLDSDEEAAIRTKIKDPLLKLRNSMLELYEQVTDSTKDGIVDEGEANSLTKKVKDVEQDVLELSKAFSAAVGSSVHKSFEARHSAYKGQFHVLFTICSIARSIIDLALKLSLREPPSKPNLLHALQECSVFSGMWTSTHQEFATRNSLSLILCFLLGYFGDGAVIPPYSAGIAVNASLLLSNFVGSALQKNMSRVQGLVIGGVTGHFLHGICSMMGCGTIGFSVASMVTLGVFCLLSFYIYMASASFGPTASLFGGIGSMYILASCGEHIAGTSAYLDITCATVCFVIMAGVDLMLAPSAALEARNFYLTFLGHFRMAVDSLVQKGAMPENLTITDMVGDVQSADVSANEADKAPVTSSKPFTIGLYQSLVETALSCVRGIEIVQWTFSRTSGDGKADPESHQVLKSCKSFEAVSNGVAELLYHAHILVEATLHSHSCMQAVHACKDTPLDHKSVKEKLVVLTKEVGTAIDGKGKSEKTAIDLDPEVRLHVILSELYSFVDSAEAMKDAALTHL